MHRSRSTFGQAQPMMGMKETGNGLPANHLSIPTGGRVNRTIARTETQATRTMSSLYGTACGMILRDTTLDILSARSNTRQIPMTSTDLSSRTIRGCILKR